MNNGVKWTADLENELCTPEEIAENNLQAQLICALVDARHEKGISQRDLESISGIKQSTIARIERGAINPTIDPLTRLLTPLGITLTIQPIAK